MGFFDKIKGWLNIGGPKVAVNAVDQPITGMAGTIIGVATVTSTREAKITSITTRFIVEETTGTGEDKETESATITEETTKGDITVEAGGSHMIDISLAYDTAGLADKLAAKGGLRGAVGKISKMAGKLGEKGVKDYYVEVECDVAGTAFDPSDRLVVSATIDD
jgi:hypothetical protein